MSTLELHRSTARMARPPVDAPACLPEPGERVEGPAVVELAFTPGPEPAVQAAGLVSVIGVGFAHFAGVATAWFGALGPRPRD